MKIDNLPFHIGGTEGANNPAGLPDTYPFVLHFDPQQGAITQQVTPDLLWLLDQAYLAGQLIGTPLDEDSYGKPYADDFLNFIERAGIPRGANALEIGAGVGYLTRRLNEAGWNAIGIEPGHGYVKHWERNGVEIINDYFPTARINGKFDLICSYAVLEHITDPVRFLNDIRNHLALGGKAFFSVPDCTNEILLGDPSILFHEHFSYFDAGALTRIIQSVGLYASVVRSSYGRCLYAVASDRELFVAGIELGLEKNIIETYPDRCAAFMDRARAKIAAMLPQGTLGVYCAARGLALLDPSWDMRFFDDDPALHGKYLPPFQVPIASRQELKANPVANLLILSHTFGDRIRTTLVNEGYYGQIITLSEL